MAQFSIEINDSDVSKVITALCENYGFDPSQNESSNEFANRMVRKFIEDNVAAYLIREAKLAAKQATNTSVSISRA